MRENDLKKSFGASIRTWRKRLGISQEELAERATLHRTYISDVERGARNVSLQSIERLARALDASLPAIFSYDANPATSGVDSGMVDILYVESDPGDVRVTMQVLRHAKIANRIFIVHDGVSALDFLLCTGRFSGRAPGGRPQLVLLSLDLPRISGSELIERIRKDPRTRSIPVVALCDAGDERAVTMSLRQGANTSLFKPLDFQRFNSVIPQLNLQWALHQTPLNGPK